jgi:hypothetical protein
MEVKAIGSATLFHADLPEGHASGVTSSDDGWA